MGNKRSWKNALRWLQVFGWLMALSHPIEAHSPYFTRSEKVALPDGRSGEMRIIAGDGIMVADPTRLLILDDHGRLLARSARWQFVELVCEAARHCYGYNLTTSEIIEPDPATFRADGPQVPPVDWKVRDDLWPFEDGPDAWGVKARPATATERLFADWYLLRRSPVTMAYGISLGMIVGLPFLGARRPRTRAVSSFILWCIGLSLRLAGSLILGIIGVAWTVFMGPLHEAFFYLVVIGAFTFHLLIWTVKRLRNSHTGQDGGSAGPPILTVGS